MNTLTRTDRIQGMLLGHLVGDALGSAYEFGAAFPEGGSDPVMGTGVFGHPKGSGTDDTDVLRCCARTLIERGGFAPSTYAEHLATWKATGPKDIGGQTSRAIRTWVAKGEAPRPDERAQGNGALMGCAPLAALGSAHVAEAAAAELSMTTHPSSASVRACSAYARLLWHVVNDQADAEAMERSPWDLITPRVAEWKPDGPSIGWVLGSYRLALEAWTMAKECGPVPALIYVVCQGGDTDTNAAIAGALLGATYGADAFAEIAGDLLPSERAANEGLALQLAAL